MLRKKIFLFSLFFGVSILTFAQHINKRPPLVDLQEIKEITVFYPSSRIEVVGKGMEQMHYDSASLLSATLNLDIIHDKKDIFEQVYFYPKENIPAYDLFTLDLMELAWQQWGITHLFLYPTLQMYSYSLWTKNLGMRFWPKNMKGMKFIL